MELVYLWVEDYKNIKNQGFNFSPRFRCEYDPVANELTICDKKKDECQDNDYIENFFGDNINVTAIVGKNGSGKSSLLELIKHDGYENPIKNPYPIFFLDLKEVRVYYRKEENKLYIYENKLEVNLKSKLIIERIEDIGNNSFNQIFIKPAPLHDQKEYVWLLDFLRNNQINFPFSIPQFIGIGIHDDYYELLEIIKSEEFEFYTIYSVFEEDKDKRIKIFYIILLIAYLKNHSIDFSIEANKDHNITIKELESYIPENMTTLITNFIDAINTNLESFSQNPYHYLDINKIPLDFFEIYKRIVAKKHNDEEFLDFRGKQVFTFNFFPPLSDGEYQSIYLFSQIYSEKIELNNIQLLVDEGENFLHPNWQKKYLGNLIKFLRNNYTDKKIHLIVTTHSPFLLSDIPKQNIIFLNTDENGNCIVVDGLNDKKETFGANIHTLLSDSFFMEDGLIGEFAKGKIQEILDFLNDKKSVGEISTKEVDIKKVIESMGEPFLKDKLLQMYEEKYPKTDKERIRELEAEIKRIRSGKD